MLTQLPACSVLTHLPCLPAPAGSGKTHLVRALAAEAGLPIVTLNGGECVGENAEKNMRRAFSSGASAARPACPACTLVWCSVADTTVVPANPAGIASSACGPTCQPAASACIFRCPFAPPSLPPWRMHCLTCSQVAGPLHPILG